MQGADPRIKSINIHEQGELSAIEAIDILLSEELTLHPALTPESLICACGGCLHRIGEDVSERLDVVPAQFRVYFADEAGNLHRLSAQAAPIN